MDDLDRWTPVSVLGTGAFGQVHLAWDRTERRWVALKRFTGQDELGLLRFVIESRIRVDHPHLVRSLAFRLVDDDAVLVTELARGGSLRQLMSRAGPLPGPWVATAVGQVLHALAALHAHGVVHRDLKPANLLLRDPGSAPPHVLVADFGIATWRTVSLTGVGAAIGTPGYLAPEYLAAGTPSPRSDLFAVGVLAAELLAGRRLIHESNATPDIPSDWSAQLPLPNGLAPKLAAVLRRMADPDPSARYLDCTEAGEALRHAMPAGAPVVVPGVDLLDGLPAGWAADGPTDAPTVEATPMSTTDLPVPAAHRPLARPGTPTPPPGQATSPESPTPAPRPPLRTDQRTPAPGTPTPPPGTATQSGAPPGTPIQHDQPTPAPGPPSWPAPPTPMPGAQRRTDQPTPAGAAIRPESPTSAPGTATWSERPTPGPGTPTWPGQPTTPPGTAMWSAPAPPKKRRAPWIAALAVLVVLAGAGIAWAALANRVTPANPAPSETGHPAAPQAAWTPEPLAQCALAERGAQRTIEGRTARCQRTSADRQDWVAEPTGGFPVSNPSGPFPGEACGTSPDTDYSPTGIPVTCVKRKWIAGT